MGRSTAVLLLTLALGAFVLSNLVHTLCMLYVST